MKKKVKPILIIGVPHLRKEALARLRDDLINYLGKDYYVLVYPEQSEMKFQLFNADDIDDIKLSELKKIIEENLKDIT